MFVLPNPAVNNRSPSSRRAWIEIGSVDAPARGGLVALLAEGVDRNSIFLLPASQVLVALLAEGVDRNPNSDAPIAENGRVALLAEGVDRN